MFPCVVDFTSNLGFSPTFGALTHAEKNAINLVRERGGGIREYEDSSKEGSEAAACVITIVDDAFHSGIFGAIISGFGLIGRCCRGRRRIVCNRGRWWCPHIARDGRWLPDRIDDDLTRPPPYMLQ